MIARVERSTSRQSSPFWNLLQIAGFAYFSVSADFSLRPSSATGLRMKRSSGAPPKSRVTSGSAAFRFQAGLPIHSRTLQGPPNPQKPALTASQARFWNSGPFAPYHSLAILPHDCPVPLGLVTPGTKAVDGRPSR